MNEVATASLGRPAAFLLATVVCGALLCGLGASADAATNKSSPKLTRAAKSLLALSDMPKGWTSTGSSNGSTTPPGAAQLASCLGVPTSTITANPPSAYSREFDSKNKMYSVNDKVSVFASAKTAQADIATDANPKASKCLTANLNGPGKAYLDSGFGSGVSVGNVTVSRTPVGDYAPHTSNVTLFVPVAHQGVVLNVELTEVVFVKGNEEQTVTLTSVQGQFPIALGRRLTTAADARL